MSDPPWYAYILESARERRLYVGITTNVERRLVAHNSGKGAKTTRGRGPWKVLGVRLCGTKGDALRYEYWLKSLTKENRIRWGIDNVYKDKDVRPTNTSCSESGGGK